MTEHHLSDEDRHNIFPEIHSTIEGIFEHLNKNPNWAKTDYGHAAAMITVAAYAVSDEFSFDEQKEHLKRIALDYIGKFGPKFIEFMKPELREALGIKP